MHPLLNLCCDLQLTNINAGIPNAPAGDLICRSKLRAFQITINATTAKIRDVHEKAAALAASADRLTIFFVVEGKLRGNPAGLTVCTAPVIDKLNIDGRSGKSGNKIQPGGGRRSGSSGASNPPAGPTGSGVHFAAIFKSAGGHFLPSRA